MEDNLYNLDEEDNTSYSIESASDDEADTDLCIDVDQQDEEEEEEAAWTGERPDRKRGNRSPWLMLAECIFSPVGGFKNLKRSKITSDKFAAQCLYPLTAMAAVANFAELFYDSDATVVSSLIDGIISFITFFFGYFTTLLCGKWLLSKDASAALTRDYGKNLIIACFCSLLLLYIIYSLFPILGPVVGLMPIWTIYMLNKGVKYMQSNCNTTTKTRVILSFLIIFAPLMWYWIFSDILPVME